MTNDRFHLISLMIVRLHHEQVKIAQCKQAADLEICSEGLALFFFFANYFCLRLKEICFKKYVLCEFNITFISNELLGHCLCKNVGAKPLLVGSLCIFVYWSYNFKPECLSLFICSCTGGFLCSNAPAALQFMDLL